ncbi:TMEM165/GDT1 family protein [Acinetobacter larvae]|uniref:GDT1 family protein n=1 Tax=Acinetobacter larvae TaxID=1789224 RepID=A0A1B2M390_9GAMM|nr:TMEM165/GDT1 family protein [Acinetobacter larvae]AOA59649.1 hypothetical protein BFG52_15705 [Acinetobacter larvae]
MQELISSTLIVALAEMGDKTQLLALLLAARFKKPIPIIAAILVSTLINHALSAVFGQWITAMINPTWLVWVLSIGFIAMAIWMLIPDKLEDESENIKKWQKFGVFGATFILFTLAEIGDKTQLATVALAAKYDSIFWVTMGTTLGMLIANVPAVLVGDRFAQRLPIALIHKIGACIFMALGVMTLLGYYLL